MDALKYGDKISVDFGTLPEVSQRALAQRGLTHILGNEIASKVHSWAQQEGQANSDDKAVVKAWKDGNADKISAKTSEFQADALKALADGTLGDRVGGPRLTPIETVKRQIARTEIEATLRGNKIKVPKGDETVTMNGEAFTMAQLIDRRLAKPDHADRINGLAVKELARRAKAQQAAESAAAGVEDL